LRYRAYVYDHETALYYLQSRYYDPELGRFINADNYPSTGQGLLGNNMFAYCNNNPLVFSDPTGELGAVAIAGIVVSGIIGGTVSALGAAASGKSTGEIALNFLLGAAVGAGTAAYAAVAAAAVAASAITTAAAVKSVACASAAIGAIGEGVGQIIDYAFHRNDSDYRFDLGVSMSMMAYSAGINAFAGTMSYGLNTVFLSGIDELIGVAVSAEASVALGGIDFGVRQSVSALSAKRTPTQRGIANDIRVAAVK
jgi:RHS repeat-associated protein